VVDFERSLIERARDWVRPDVGARLTTVDLMARLQHHGVPTRLMDFSRDPCVALHFAANDGGLDGRLYGFGGSPDVPVDRLRLLALHASDLAACFLSRSCSMRQAIAARSMRGNDPAERCQSICGTVVIAISAS
jgi:hypothetical protein